MIVNACMMVFKPTILSGPDWKDIPWMNAPESKSELQHLFDIFVDLPDITRQVWYTLRSPLSMRPNATMDVDTLYRTSMSMLRALDQWRRKWWNRHSEDFFETTPTYTPRAWYGRTEELAWKTCWHFSSLYHSQAYTTYHFILIIVLRMIWNCETSGLLTVEYLEIDRSHQIYAAGIEICRCVDYHLHESLSGAGSLFLLVPVRVAWKSLGESSTESQWLVAAMRDVSEGERGRWSIATGTVSNYKLTTGSPLAEVMYESTASPTEP